MKVLGIYLIRNEVTSQEYVGSSDNVRRRLSHHFSALRNNRHYNKKLQNSFNKYGEEAFTHRTLEVVGAGDELLTTEQRHMDELKPYFNILPLAGRTEGFRHAEAVKARMSVRSKGAGNGMHGKSHTPEAIAKIAIASSARRSLQSTCDALALGHGWNRGKPWSEATKKKMSDAKKKKPVVRTCPATGDQTTYASIRDAMRDGFHASHVGACCAGKVATHKGYRWTYAA